MTTEEKQINGNPLHPRLDPFSPFSQPPAPPPQQPLPEKPDSAVFSIPESFSSPSLKRTETEKPRSPLHSPTRTDPPSGQIVSLLEALKSARQEIDSQGDRVKYLESALARERKAREHAERHAESLSEGRILRQSHETNGAANEELFESPLDSVELMDQDSPSCGRLQDKEGDNRGLSRSISTATLKGSPNMHQDTEEVDASTSRLQARVDLMVKEMDEMKQIMESYKRRAEDAEEGRRSLAQMVENIRAGRGANDTPTMFGKDSVVPSSGISDSALDFSKLQSSGDNDRGLVTTQAHRPHPNGNAAIGDIQREFQNTVSNVLQQHQRSWNAPGESGRMVQSAPYLSMVGVVIIGVSIMTYLNGWQPGGEK